MSRALAGFTHPGLDRILQWDLRHGADVVAELLSHVSDRSAPDRARDGGAGGVVSHRAAGRGPAAAGGASGSHRCERGGVARPWRCPRRRGHRLRGPDRQLGRGRTGDHGVVCAWACGQRPDLGAAGDPGVQRHSATFGRGSRSAVAAAGVAHRGADRQRRAAGRARPRQRLRHRAVRRRMAHVRTGHLGADGRHDRGDQGRPGTGLGACSGRGGDPARRRRLGGDAGPVHHVGCVRRRSLAHNGCRGCAGPRRGRRGRRSGGHRLRSAEAEPGTEAEPREPRGRADRHRHVAGVGHRPAGPVGRRGGGCLRRCRHLPRRRL